VIEEADIENILEKAYIPEHIVPMMVLLSKGEPFLLEDFLSLAGEDWLIVVGYPLETPFQPASLERIVRKACKRFRPSFGWIMAPEPLAGFQDRCTESQSDYYYVLDLRRLQLPRRLVRVAERASDDLLVERSEEMTEEHRLLIQEFLDRTALSPRVKHLYLSLPEYVNRSQTSVVLSAWTRERHLSAFYVIELAARHFGAYLAGCYSHSALIPHASDLLFHEMVRLAQKEGKSSINLGLGVNNGIRRFKEKWGGTLFLPYEYGEFRSKGRWVLDLLSSFAARG
jgi:hypothetical protein